MIIGEISELWRYCVSSIGGEALTTVSIADDGVPGDRKFCLFDPATGTPAAPEKEARWRPALFLCSRQGQGVLPEIGFADGRWLRIDDAALPQRLQEHFGFTVAIGEYGADGLRRTALPAVKNRYAPSPMHLLTTGSLAHLAELCGGGPMDSRRFRPTVLINTAAAPGFCENDWIGAVVGLGSVRVQITEATKRCGMTLIAQPAIAEQPDVLRSILRHNGRNLGVYGTIEQAGDIRLGDPVRLYI